MKRREAKPKIRCAIYTRKSSEEGLDQEYNSLDAQRDAAEAYVASQKAEGWVALPDRYDDGGFSGGSMERPALDRMLRDIERGKIDCVVVYKVDRLSRSLMDFSRIMSTFDSHGVSFVSVTQQFNTTHSMGRLTLNILLSFAQFEREIIGERIRDKLAAQARKGQWTGGAPVLGYDVDRSAASPRLVINAREASRVREIFRLYLEEASMLAVVRELAKRGWKNKKRMTKKGKELGGKAFNKASIHSLLTNPIYTGKIKHKENLYNGAHEAIIDEDVFERVQNQLKKNGRSGGVEVRNKYGALLRGLLRCESCDAAMTHTFTGKDKSRMYRYYRCTHAIKNGHDTCNSGTLPAGEIERVVVEEVRGLSRDKALMAQVLADANAAIQTDLAAVKRNHDDLSRQIDRDRKELHDLVVSKRARKESSARFAELNERIMDAESNLPNLKSQIAELKEQIVTETETKAAFSNFDALWDNLAPREQARVLRLLISSVEYDGKTGNLSINFRPTNIRSLINRNLEGAA